MNPPSIAAGSCVVGQKEGEGPLRKWFDYISDDSYFGQSSWEKAESVMLSKCFALCCDKARIPPSDIQYLFAGDLLNQCAGSTFAARDLPIPYFGVYGACSTMAESLSLAAMTIDGGYADTVCAMDRDRRGRAAAHERGRRPLCDARHDRAHPRRGRDGREQHGRGNGSGSI